MSLTNTVRWNWLMQTFRQLDPSIRDTLEKRANIILLVQGGHSPDSAMLQAMHEYSIPIKGTDPYRPVPIPYQSPHEGAVDEYHDIMDMQDILGL